MTKPPALQNPGGVWIQPNNTVEKNFSPLDTSRDEFGFLCQKPVRKMQRRQKKKKKKAQLRERVLRDGQRKTEEGGGRRGGGDRFLLRKLSSVSD